jgi:ABC-type lipoprotein export system ATPase subunit
MYVRRLRLHGVKMLHRDIPEGGEPFPEATRTRLLLQGGNGSGKTTILECIRLLWEFFGEWIDQGNRGVELVRRLLRALTNSTEQALRRAQLAAMELGDFPVAGQQLWIGMGEVNAWKNLKRQNPSADFAGMVWDAKDHRNDPGIELPLWDWKAFRQRSMVGSEPQVNIVHFPPDNRTVAPTPELGPRLIDTTKLNWSAVYSPDLDLDSLLLTLKALRPQDYDETVRLVNLALAHRNKRIVGFGDDGRLAIEGETDFGTTYQHPPEHLSSGERQILLMVAYVGGFLRPGGILLIDEPDLHIHLSMISQLLETLNLIVRARRGQLIVASHSERVWDWFTRDDEKTDLTPWRGGKS